jgi:hypothetical protein
MGRRHDRIATVTGRNPKQCPDHGEPTNEPGDQPTYCLDCDRAIRATGNACWRHEKPKTQAEVEAEQKADDEEAERKKTFAERMHAARAAKKETRELLARMTPEERADAKNLELAKKALRKAKKLRKARGLTRR